MFFFGQLGKYLPLLGAVLPRSQATVVAVLSRLLFVLGDLGWSAVALVGAGRRPR